MLGLDRVSNRVRVRIRVKVRVSVMVRVSIRTSWVVNFALFRCYPASNLHSSPALVLDGPLQTTRIAGRVAVQKQISMPCVS